MMPGGRIFSGGARPGAGAALSPKIGRLRLPGGTTGAAGRTENAQKGRIAGGLGRHLGEKRIPVTGITSRGHGSS
jgi:hypothetical protein